MARLPETVKVTLLKAEKAVDKFSLRGVPATTTTDDGVPTCTGTGGFGAGDGLTTCTGGCGVGAEVTTLAADPLRRSLSAQQATRNVLSAVVSHRGGCIGSHAEEAAWVCTSTGTST